jgi:hypothetical protein
LRSRGQLIGTILIVAGLVIALSCSVWAIVARGEESGLATSGLALALAGATVLAVPFVGMGIYLFVKGQQEAAELADVRKERAVLNMVQTQGQVRVSDVALELDVTLDQVRAYIHDLVGKGLFSGYINWDEGLLYSRDASQLRGDTCPNCGGELELAGKGVIRCPYCGSEIFL